jgi:hypothetical protein
VVGVVVLKLVLEQAEELVAAGMAAVVMEAQILVVAVVEAIQQVMLVALAVQAS